MSHPSGPSATIRDALDCLFAEFDLAEQCLHTRAHWEGRSVEESSTTCAEEGDSRIHKAERGRDPTGTASLSRTGLEFEEHRVLASSIESRLPESDAREGV